MVRLMGWMIGLALTTMSSSIRSQFNQQNKIKDPEKRFYDEPQLDFWSTDFSHEKNALVKPQFRHLMELPANESERCIPPAINDFPPDFFTQEQRVAGGLILHFLLGIYACYGLAAICDTYFVPSLELISERMGLSSDVAGATFMAAGTSSPEFFESIIGSFVTEGDIGVGTIVGSAVFNILAVTSVCGILAGKIVPLDWWPLTRDCFFYALSVLALIGTIYDGKVYWYESTILLVMFVVYVLMMRFNTRLSTYFHSLSFCKSKEKKQLSSEYSSAHSGTATIKQAAVGIAEDTRNILKENGNYIPSEDVESNGLLEEKNIKNTHVEESEEVEEEESDFSPLELPNGFWRIVAYIVTYPINLLFYFTVPNCNKPQWRRFFALTFFMSVVYIGSLAYFVAWMVTVIGYTVGIPDTVMGITFLAIGTSIPEAYSSVIVCRKGYGNMAISNSVGSNVFDILFCLGLPWLIKATAFSNGGYVIINSSGLVYSTMSLLATVVVLFGVIALCKFRLNLKVGITCLLFYSVFLVFASLVEMNIFGDVNPPSCLT